jgi:hypothetical protein
MALDGPIVKPQIISSGVMMLRVKRGESVLPFVDGPFALIPSAHVASTSAVPEAVVER